MCLSHWNHLLISLATEIWENAIIIIIVIMIVWEKLAVAIDLSVAIISYANVLKTALWKLWILFHIHYTLFSNTHTQCHGMAPAKKIMHNIGNTCDLSCVSYILSRISFFCSKKTQYAAAVQCYSKFLFQSVFSISFSRIFAMMNNAIMIIYNCGLPRSSQTPWQNKILRFSQFPKNSFHRLIW